MKGFTVFYWATGTWWIPMLIILAVWRHVYKRYPVKYDPLVLGSSLSRKACILFVHSKWLRH